MRQNRRGSSTLAHDPRPASAANACDRIDVKRRIAHLGNAALCYVHRMRGGMVARSPCRASRR